MHLRSLRVLSPSLSTAQRAARVYDRGDLSLESQVQNALNLALTLKTRAQMPALLATIDAAKDQIHAALTGLHYVHFARFLPTPDFSALQVVTSYDGDLESYLMDFVRVGLPLNVILWIVSSLIIPIFWPL